jgi:hypothetical protein
LQTILALQGFLRHCWFSHLFLYNLSDNGSSSYPVLEEPPN